MGIALWIVAAAVVFALTRPVGLGRIGWPLELGASVATAFVLGAVATRLDFGGWNEPDWRSGLFAGFGSLAAIAVVRLVSSTRAPVSGSASRAPSKR